VYNVDAGKVLRKGLVTTLLACVGSNRNLLFVYLARCRLFYLVKQPQLILASLNIFFCLSAKVLTAKMTDLFMDTVNLRLIMLLLSGKLTGIRLFL